MEQNQGAKFCCTTIFSHEIVGTDKGALLRERVQEQAPPCVPAFRCWRTNISATYVQELPFMEVNKKAKRVEHNYRNCFLFLNKTCMLQALHSQILGHGQLILASRFCQKYGTKAIVQGHQGHTVPSTQDLFVFFIWLSPQYNLITFNSFRQY